MKTLNETPAACDGERKCEVEGGTAAQTTYGSAHSTTHFPRPVQLQMLCPPSTPYCDRQQN